MTTITFSQVCLLVLLVSIAVAQKDPQPDQLIELFRHGARGPLESYDDSWPLSQYGVLTAVGMRQQYILGKVLSEKYAGLLSSTYDYNNIYMISDTTPRCIQSGLVHLYGIYLGTGLALRDNYPAELAIPPYQDPLVKQIADSLADFEALPYKEVPNIVNIVDNSNGYIFQGDSSNYCPNADQWNWQNSIDNASKNAFQIFADTINNVNSHLNQSLQLKTAFDISSFGDALLVDQYDNRTLPANVTDPDLVANVTFAFTWFTQHLWHGQLIQRQLNSFNLIDAVLTQLASYREGQTYNKVAFYSGHDSNVLAVLSAFGIVTEDCILANFYSYVANKTVVYPNCYFPYFASDIAFEFYNETESPYVEFYYNGVLIPLCNGKDSCSYDDFVFFARNASGNNTLQTYFEQCGANNTFVNPHGSDVPRKTFGGKEPLHRHDVVAKEELVIVQSTDLSTETIAIISLSIVCIFLIGMIVSEKRKNRKIAKDRREDTMIRSEFLIIR